MYRIIVSIAVGVSLLAQKVVRADEFSVTNLITDNALVHPAQITDPALRNAWGVSYSPTGEFWVSDNAAGVATTYRVDPATNATSQLPTTVTIRGDGSVTGQVFNGGVGFNSDQYLFVSEDGTVNGWRPALGTNTEILATGVSDNVYKGAAQATIDGHSYLYAANFRSGKIDVYKGDSAAPGLLGNFTDPNLPANYAPFNIQKLNGKLYVTYALQDAAQKDDAPGAGHGFVTAFDLQGIFLGRVASANTLNSPWGLAIAPSTFGSFAGDLLVGNFGDGRISAFDLVTNAFEGQLLGIGGTPLSIDGLWALTPGNGGDAGDPLSIYFSSGPDDEAHGLFGVITLSSLSPPSAVPEPAAITLAAIGTCGAFGYGWRRRNHAPSGDAS
jgi:uncharacterized protein (TIGR03118 family)